MKKTPKKEFTVQGLYARILDTLGWTHYATAKQLTRYLLSVSSLTHMQEKLRDLIKYDYVKAFPLYTGLRSNVTVYTLAGRGMNYLKQTGQIEQDRHYRPSEVARSPYFLPHTLDVNDVMVALMLLVNNDENIQLLDRKHEIDIKRERIKQVDTVTFPWAIGEVVREEKMLLYPDSFMVLSYQSPTMDTARRFPLWLEIDRGTETRIDDFRKRIRAMIQYAKMAPVRGMKEETSPFTKRYGFKFPIYTYVITQGGQARADVLCEHARKELASTNEKIAMSRMFRFAVAPPSWDYLEEETKTGRPLDVAYQLAFGKRWAIPFVDHDTSELLRIGK